MLQMNALPHPGWIAGLLLLTIGLLGCGEPDAEDPAEDVPPTDVFLADLSVDGDRVTLRPPRNITVRADGYDNQPHFTADGRGLLYTSVHDGRADIYRFDLIFRNTEPVLQTETSEFSPTPVPGRESRFTTVRVEEDGTQRLWQIDLSGENDPEVLLPDVEPVGYHAWADEERVALFVLGDPPTLQLANVRTGEIETLAEDIGPSLQSIPGESAISFVHNRDDEPAQIKRLDAETGTIEPLIDVIDDVDGDHAWTPEGVLLGVSGPTLYKWAPNHDVSWEPVVEVPGIEFTRLAVHPDGDRLALVVEEPDDEDPDEMDVEDR